MAIRQRLFSPSQEWWSSAIFGDSGSLSRWRRALRLVRHTVRLPVSLDKALRSLAEQQGISVYAMLQRSVKAGVATLADPPAPSTATQEIVAELASVSTRIVDVERMLDRALFTACAAYCYARSAALGRRTDDEAVTAEVNAAYERQRRLSQDRRR